MTKAICIVHSIGYSNNFWLSNLLDSIDTHYPIVISNHHGWVMDGIKKIYDTTDFDEMLFLNDSCVIKDNSIFDIVFEEYHGRSVCLAERMMMFCGKFLRSEMAQMEFPVITSKVDDVWLGETGWALSYLAKFDCHKLEPLLDDDYGKYEELNGRKNMILENQWIKKYKGHWNMEMVEETDATVY